MAGTFSLDAYLDDAGMHCPACGEAHPRRIMEVVTRQLERGRECVIQCYCGKCAVEWQERYALVDVGLVTVPGEAKGQ